MLELLVFCVMVLFVELKRAIRPSPVGFDELSPNPLLIVVLWSTKAPVDARPVHKLGAFGSNTANNNIA
jgi:hypothetical protein